MNGSKRIIVDSGALIALVDKSDAKHRECINVLKKLPEVTEYITTESCLAEATYILPGDDFVQRLGQLVNVLQISLVSLVQTDLERVFELLKKYRDLPMDFADASIVVTAEKLKIETVFTIDRRDFVVYRPKHIKSFRLVPR